MELKTNSWRAWYYKQFYCTDKLPKSLCVYFWKLLISLILFSVTYPAFILNVLFKEHVVPFLLGAMMWIVSLMFWDIVIHPKNHHLLINLQNFMIYPLLGFITICVGSAICFGAGYLIVNFGFYLYHKKDNRKNKKEKVALKPNIITTYAKAFIGRFCPIIHWR